MTSTASTSGVARKRWSFLRTISLGLLAVVLLYGSFAAYLATRPVVISFNPLQRFRDALPNGTLVTVPNCGHNVHGQNTLGFIGAIGGFLESLG